MATIYYDGVAFRALFPLYKDINAFPDPALQIYWNTATAYISNQTCGWNVNALKPAQQVLALNLMTAHLLFLGQQINAGQTTGLVQGATIDKVTVTLTPPPEVNQWQWWLNQSPYGQQLLAILQIGSVGGFFFGGFPTAGTLRR